MNSPEIDLFTDREYGGYLFWKTSTAIIGVFLGSRDSFMGLSFAEREAREGN